MSPITVPPAKALQLHSLIAPTYQGSASRVLAKTAGGNLTLFAFDAGQGLTEHTSSFDALRLYNGDTGVVVDAGGGRAMAAFERGPELL